MFTWHFANTWYILDVCVKTSVLGTLYSLSGVMLLNDAAI